MTVGVRREEIVHTPERFDWDGRLATAYTDPTGRTIDR